VKTSLRGGETSILQERQERPEISEKREQIRWGERNRGGGCGAKLRALQGVAAGRSLPRTGRPRKKGDAGSEKKGDFGYAAFAMPLAGFSLGRKGRRPIQGAERMSRAGRPR